MEEGIYFVSFIPELDLEWELGLDTEVVFEPDEQAMWCDWEWEGGNEGGTSS